MYLVLRYERSQSSGWTVQGSNPGRSNRFFSGSEGYPASFWVLIRQRHLVNQSLSPSAKVKNEWSCTSTSLCLRGMNREHFMIRQPIPIRCTLTHGTLLLPVYNFIVLQLFLIRCTLTHGTLLLPVYNFIVLQPFLIRCTLTHGTLLLPV